MQAKVWLAHAELSAVADLGVLAGACGGHLRPSSAGSSFVQRPEGDWRRRRICACCAASCGACARWCCEADRCCATRTCEAGSSRCAAHRRIRARAGAFWQARSDFGCHDRDGGFSPGARVRCCLELLVRPLTCTLRSLQSRRRRRRLCPSARPHRLARPPWRRWQRCRGRCRRKATPRPRTPRTVAALPSPPAAGRTRASRLSPTTATATSCEPRTMCCRCRLSRASWRACDNETITRNENA